MNTENIFTGIKNLGPCEIASPLAMDGKTRRFCSDDEKVLLDDRLDVIQAQIKSGMEIPSLEKAGPRRSIYFDPKKTRCAIVTCGGLCPGLNDVIRGITLHLHYRYGVNTVYGIRYGYEGFIRSCGHEFILLTPENVANIHLMGGSFLGSSRGNQDIGDIVNRLEELKVNILFVIGGDGTLRGSIDISREVQRRGGKMSVIGIPKTIDNDIMYLDRSFGFETAFTEAVESIKAAHVEALGAVNGVGLVKLMGRQSGFIACFAALATNDANFVLIPEVPFKLSGENGLLNLLKQRLESRRHAVIVVAEGAGQDLVEGDSSGKDASGNIRLKDIGLYLKHHIENHFKGLQTEVNVKYIDPSYVVRSVPAAPNDAFFCSRLAQNAVHAGMCGKTEMVVGRWHTHFVHLPTEMTTSKRRQVDSSGDLWMSVLEATGQPDLME